jgi:hypothetical protein
MQHGRPLCCRWHQGAAFVISGPDASALPQTPSQFYRSDRAAIAKCDGRLPDTLVSWIKTLAFVRNISAHPARLWNAGVINQPLVPKPFEAPHLVDIGSDLERRTRVYGAAAVASCFVRRINPVTSWPSRMKGHWQAFPVMPFASPIQGCFLTGWDAEAIGA